ncbi:uncharacterized protein B0H18DRAFT_1054066 [Fomitopsis serialis]|uniref:uncharacterized protein n=1 Tax=Fomitopsis serialis TaxID=139415 RepID=UPI00200797A5|nr:uncharacterized protein B0H18DRAFT_1054066 [Neoantrodia serialis]KAH9912436.1 hypothetical protein B0H18DRAFT_1054066 [Neoantrodia serialis]
MADDLCAKPPFVWDWDIEHADRKAETKADAAVHGAPPFQVDRKLLKDIVHEKMGENVVRIKFLGAGTFHKAYSITLASGKEVIARVARRFMPRLKTESEIATMQYLRERTNVPVPDVYHYDANPYNRLGGEYIIMSKAPGIPLSKVFHSLSHEQLVVLMENVVALIIPLFAHRFPGIGSLYAGPDPDAGPATAVPTCFSSAAPTPTVAFYQPAITRAPLSTAGSTATATPSDASTSTRSQFHVGPIVSWPFFGSHRGELAHPSEMDRGPWATTDSYLKACAAREVVGVRRENDGKAAPHRLHLDPGEVDASRHHHVEALPGDESDTSEEWDWDESEDEWEGPGDNMYRDYRRMQRSTFLVAHLKEREEKVRREMERVVRMMERLRVPVPGSEKQEGDGGGGGGAEEFGLDCHDLSLENVFVDERDHAKITCIIDWESTTTRPLWACAHVPTFMQSSPFTSKLFRAMVERLASRPASSALPIVIPSFADGHPTPVDIVHAAEEWLHHEAAGARLRMAHRCIEWDGWEEGLVDSILGPEEEEEEWFKSWECGQSGVHTPEAVPVEVYGEGEAEGGSDDSGSPTLVDAASSDGERKAEGNAKAETSATGKAGGKGAVKVPMAKKVVQCEKEKEKLLKETGDFCGGRGGELGRRLEAWLHVSGDGTGRVGLERRWTGEGYEDVEVPLRQ